MRALNRLAVLTVVVSFSAAGCTKEQSSSAGGASNTNGSVQSDTSTSVALAPVATTVLGGPAIAADPAIVDTSILKLKKEGVLTVCADMPYPPFEFFEGSEKFVDATSLDQQIIDEGTTTTKARKKKKKKANQELQANGKTIGITVELVDVIAKGMGLRADFVNTSFDGIFNALGSGSCDLIASSITITKDRKQAYYLSQSYFTIRQAILTRASDTSFVDLATLRGQTVGVQAATTGSELANTTAKANGFRVKEYATVENMIAGLSRGDVGAVIHDAPIVGYAAIRSRLAVKQAGVTMQSVDDGTTVPAVADAPIELAVSKIFDGPKDTADEYAMVVRKDNPALTAAINSALNQARQSGSYTQILRKYLGAIAGS